MTGLHSSQPLRSLTYGWRSLNLWTQPRAIGAESVVVPENHRHSATTTSALLAATAPPTLNQACR